MRLISHAVVSLFTATPAPRPKATELFDDIAVDKIMAALSRLPDPTDTRRIQKLILGQKRSRQPGWWLWRPR